MKINCAYKEIPGYSKYFATEEGKIVSKKTGFPIQEKFRKDGYIDVLVSPDHGPKYKLELQHRLICKAFNGASNLEVNHIDGVKDNNRPNNLEWCTRSQNIRHSIYTLGNNHVSKSFGNPNSRISKLDHIRIVNWYRDKVLDAKELSKFFGVNKATIMNHIRNSKRILNGHAD